MHTFGWKKNRSKDQPLQPKTAPEEGTACRGPTGKTSQSREDDAALRLILAFFVFVADFAIVVGLEENDLAQSFVRINLCGQRRGIADFESHEAFPLRLERRDIDDDAAARVRRLAHADSKDISRNAEILDGTRERE